MSVYGDEEAQRYDAPASPRGVRLVVLTLLLCGLGLAALPVVVYLRGAGAEPGLLQVRNHSGVPLRHVRLTRLVGEQQRLLGAAASLPDGASLEARFEPGGELRLELEFATAGGPRRLPLVLDAAASREMGALFVDRDLRLSLR